MAWDITDRFPLWGESGEFPIDGFFYEGGDQVNEKHLDALWNGVKNFEQEVDNALTDIDSDQDGKVDAADDADAYSGTVPSDGTDGQFLQTNGSDTLWETVELPTVSNNGTTLVNTLSVLNFTESIDAVATGNGGVDVSTNTQSVQEQTLIHNDGYTGGYIS